MKFKNLCDQACSPPCSSTMERWHDYLKSGMTIFHCVRIILHVSWYGEEVTPCWLYSSSHYVFPINLLHYSLVTKCIDCPGFLLLHFLQDHFHVKIMHSLASRIADLQQNGCRTLLMSGTVWPLFSYLSQMIEMVSLLVNCHWAVS